MGQTRPSFPSFPRLCLLDEPCSIAVYGGHAKAVQLCVLFHPGSLLYAVSSSGWPHRSLLPRLPAPKNEWRFDPLGTWGDKRQWMTRLLTLVYASYVGRTGKTQEAIHETGQVRSRRVANFKRAAMSVLMPLLPVMARAR